MSRVGVSRRAGVVVVLALWAAGCGESVRHADAGPGVSKPPGADDPRGRAGELLLLDTYGLPFANTPVLVNDSVTTTGPDGFAALPDVGEQYDVSVATQDMAYTFLGMKTRAPVVRLLGARGSAASSYISVTIQAPIDAGANQELLYSAGFSAFAAAEEIVWSEADAQGVSFSAAWPGTSPTTFSAEAFIVDLDVDTGSPVAFSRYALETWTVGPGDTLTWIPTFGPAPFATKPIYVDVTLPPDAEVYSYSAFASGQSGREGPVVAVDGAPSGEVLVPDLPDAEYTVVMGATTNNRASGFDAEADGIRAGDHVKLEVQAGPLQVAPDKGAVVSLYTDFSWTSGNEAVDQLVVYASTPDGPYTYAIVTADRSARVPDLTPLGVSFPLGTSIGWNVDAFERIPSVDAFAAGAPWHGWGETGTRSATSAP